MELSITKVLISDPVHASCAEILQNEGYQVECRNRLTEEQLIEALQDCDALIVRSETKVTKTVIEASPKLKLIGRAGTGVDNIDCTAATRNGVLVINSPNGNTISAAEHTCAMISSLARNIPQACASLKQMQWDRKTFSGVELMGKTLAVLGLGRIGREVATRMTAFGMKIIGFDPFVSAAEGKAIGIEVLSLEEIWPRADFITVHTPLIPSTRNLINADVFSRCKSDVRIVNVARGGIISEEDLLTALDNGTCGGAALDVFIEEPPKSERYEKLLKHPKLICTPHLGASTKEAQVKVAQDIAQQIVELRDTVLPAGVVNGIRGLKSALSTSNRPIIQLTKALGKALKAFTGLESGDYKADAELKITPIGNEWEETSYLGPATLIGFLSKPELDSAEDESNVNLLNSLVKAEENKLKISVEKTDDSSDSDKSLKVVYQNNENNHLVHGTMHGDSPVLLRVDDASFESGVTLAGNTLFFAGKHSQNGLASLLGALVSAQANVSMITSSKVPPETEAAQKNSKTVWYVARTNEPVHFDTVVAASNGIKLVAQCTF